METKLQQAMVAKSASNDSTASNFTRGLLANKDAEIEKLRKELDRNQETSWNV